MRIPRRVENLTDSDRAQLKRLVRIACALGVVGIPLAVILLRGGTLSVLWSWVASSLYVSALLLIMGLAEWIMRRGNLQKNRGGANVQSRVQKAR